MFWHDTPVNIGEYAAEAAEPELAQADVKVTVTHLAAPVLLAKLYES